MREVKFRAWDYKYKYMNHRVLIGNMSDDDNYCAHSAWVEPDKVDYDCEPHWANFDETGMDVMQYTGLKDVNGVEIYEGDIISCTQQRFSMNGLVTMYQGMWNWQYEKGAVSWLYEANKKWKGTVIGNIYENPELMEG